MSYTVGLDFGTHQTKICIEDASNPAQKIYEFFEFKKSKFRKSLTLPSVVQINTDDTLSFGFVNDKKCKLIQKSNLKKPVLKKLPKPVLKLPSVPKKPNYPKKPIIKEEKTVPFLEKLKNLIIKPKPKPKDPLLIQWEKSCELIDRKYKEAISHHHINVTNIEKQHGANLNIWQTECEKQKTAYNRQLRLFKEDIIGKYQFSYFKLATFADNPNWKHEISAEIISAWYLAYIIFLLQEKLGESFFIQMGIPCDANPKRKDYQRKKALAILIAAYRLVEKYQNLDNYKSQKYYNLIKESEPFDRFSEDDLLIYGIEVLPEAYAGLLSITQQGRVTNGLNLLVDIGGGTTDIAFFTIGNDQPDIHHVMSIHKGLNYILENQSIYHQKGANIEELQIEFFKAKGNRKIFGKSMSVYHEELLRNVSMLIQDIYKAFRLQKEVHRLNDSQLADALKDRPVVFSGGGSVYKTMRIQLQSFTEIKLLDQNLLNIQNLKNKKVDKQQYTILATSYGLSIPQEETLTLTPIEKVFDHIVPLNNTTNKYKFEYGITDD